MSLVPSRSSSRPPVTSGSALNTTVVIMLAEDTADTQPGLRVTSPVTLRLGDLGSLSTGPRTSVTAAPYGKALHGPRPHTLPCPARISFSQRKSYKNLKTHMSSAFLSCHLT